MTELTGVALERLADDVKREFRDRKALLAQARADGVEHCPTCGRKIGKSLSPRRKKSAKRTS